MTAHQLKFILMHQIAMLLSNCTAGLAGEKRNILLMTIKRVKKKSHRFTPRVRDL